MKTQTQHTPTPWEVSGELEHLKIVANSKEEYACDGIVKIADITPGDYEIAEYGHCEANAAFIVRAVNAYERDQEIKKELVRNLKNAHDCLLVLSEYKNTRLMKEIEQAIAKAEGK